MLTFDHLQTPPNDGDTLIEPGVDRWAELIEQNVARRDASAIELAGVEIAAARAAVRTDQLGLTADARVIAGGHQPEFIHPGVWAKQVVLRAVANASGAAGLDLIVDNDAPRSSGLLVPTAADADRLTTREVAFTQAVAGTAYEGRSTLTDAAIGSIRSELEAALGERYAASLIPAYLDELARSGDAGDAVGQHLAARRAIDAPLGADVPTVRVSQAFGGPFVADLLLGADRFAGAYNDALAEYRRTHRVRGVDRPLPDLTRDGDRIEAALWIYRSMKPRRRLWVRHAGDRVELHADRERVGTVGVNELRSDADTVLASLEPWVVRPRALTLTLWARLLACDLFVHGIGGAKYDRITDAILRQYYGCEPPAYVCVSATLRLPLSRHEVASADLAGAQLQMRDWRYNPDRYIVDPPASLLDERRRLIALADELRAARGPRQARREVFLGVRGINARLVDAHPEIGGQLAERLEQTTREVESNRIADSREYFYALQPADRLNRLVARLAGGR